MKFTKTLWNEISPVYSAILKLPFNRELAEGTLDREKFAFYIKLEWMFWDQLTSQSNGPCK